MWVMFAFGSALFAGITAVLSKIGMQDMDSDVGTAVRTGVVLVFSWMMVFLTGSIGTIGEISGRTFLFLVLSCLLYTSQLQRKAEIGGASAEGGRLRADDPQGGNSEGLLCDI